MVMVELKGGLGNQMFQYAAARALSARNEHVLLGQMKPTIFYKLFYKPHTRYIKQIGNEYVPLDGFSKYKYLYLDGYFQSEKYFRHIRPQLLNEFSFPGLDTKNQEIKEHIVNTPHAVSVHIRRGDYLKSNLISNIHPVLPVAYYQKAIDLLADKYPIELFVFSDDTIWARENIKHDKVASNYIHQANAADSWKDMALMTQCRHHIIANSSFSWWGAWLSENGGEKLAPYNWFNKAAVDYDIHDFVPDSWTILTYDA